MLTMPILTPTLQLGFYQRLVEAEKSYLLPALLNISGNLNIGELDKELLEYAGNEKLSYLASRGLRGELVFPVPYLLRIKPALLAYYRLLLGFSQKEFFRGPYSRFKKMEAANQMPQSSGNLLDDLCSSLIESSWLLINGIPNLSQEILNSLTLLTLGPQFRGSRNVNLGAEANRAILALIKSIIGSDISNEGSTFLEITNGVGRVYRIEFSPDPDIAIRQILQDGTYRNRIAIEIKGGTDFSNIHNRLGEAEKSHQKAKADKFTQFWTIINVPDFSSNIWRQETPTTDELFNLIDILNPENPEHDRFAEYLVSELGI